MKILITGGSGFIGKHLANILAEGHEVLVFDDLSGEYSNLEGLDERVEVVVGTMAIRYQIDNTIKEFDPEVIVHLAGQTSVLKSIENPKQDLEDNVISMVHLLDSVKDTNVRKIIYSSTVAVYGDCGEEEVTEENPLRPISNYGRHKLLAEEYLKESGIDYTIFRFSNVYGEDDNKGVVDTLIKGILQNKQVSLYGEDNERDFLNVYDVVGAIIKSFNKGSKQIYNLSTGESKTLKDLYEEIIEVTGKTDFDKVRKLSPKEGEILFSKVNSEKVRKELEWRPEITLKTGIELKIR